MRRAWIVIGFLAAAGPAWSQAEDQPDTAAAPSDPAAKPLGAKKAACKASGVKDGLRGADLNDHIAVCIEEARLACLKQAVAQKIRGPERKDFLAKCIDASN